MLLLINYIFLRIPFYIGMPMSTLDRDCPDGHHIPIEERPAHELFSGTLQHNIVTNLIPETVGLDDIKVWNPAFDVTPAALITAWVSEEGVWTKDKMWN